MFFSLTLGGFMYNFNAFYYILNLFGILFFNKELNKLDLKSKTSCGKFF